MTHTHTHTHTSRTRISALRSYLISCAASTQQWKSPVDVITRQDRQQSLNELPGLHPGQVQRDIFLQKKSNYQSVHKIEYTVTRCVLEVCTGNNQSWLFETDFKTSANKVQTTFTLLSYTMKTRTHGCWVHSAHARADDNKNKKALCCIVLLNQFSLA